MKRICAIAIVLLTILACAGCIKGDIFQNSSFSIEDLENALLNEDIEFDGFDVKESDNGIAFSAEKSGELILTGTADEQQNITYVKFENVGLDTSVFKNNDVFTKWYTNSLQGDFSSMTLNQLSQMIVALNCINELEAFCLLTNTSDDSFMFAVNTLLRKETSETVNWDIKVTEYSNKDTLVIEATYLG